jgi:hypothetical protein
LAYLEWASELRMDDKDPNSEYTLQARNAQEILTLYHWWVDVRPLRDDPMIASGWSALCEQRRARSKDDDDLDWLGGGDETPQERQRTSEILELSHQIEADHDAEDEEMMIRLIRIRHALWT